MLWFGFGKGKEEESRLRHLSCVFEDILCKLCESPPNLELWKYINKRLSKEDAKYIVNLISSFCFEY